MYKDPNYQNYPNHSLFDKNRDSDRIMHEINHYAKQADYKEVYVEEVVKRGSCNTLAEFRLPLPSGYPCYHLLGSHSIVKVTLIKCCRDAVMLDGLLQKAFTYAAYESSFCCPHNSTNLNANFGSVKYLSTEVPFSCLSAIVGVLPGDTAEIEFSGIESSSLVDTLSDVVNTSKSQGNMYASITEKVIINVDFIVLRKTRLTI